MKTSIRRMNTSDLIQVYPIELTVHRLPWTKEILRDCVLVGYDCQVLESIDSTDHQVLGYIISRLSGNTAHILNISIAKDQQAKGYGRQLLEHVLLRFAQLPQLTEVVMEVRVSNQNALRLYQSLGFEQVAIKKDYYQELSHNEDALVLHKRLKTH